MLFRQTIFFQCNIKSFSDFVTSSSFTHSAYNGVPITKKSVLSELSLNLLFIVQPEISLRQSPSCLRERSVSSVDKDVYTYVSSAYK